MFGEPFFLALALIVVVHLYFSNYYVKRLRAIFGTYLADMTLQAAAMQQGVMISTAMLTHYVEVIQKIHGTDFLESEHFNKEQRDAFRYILYGKGSANAPTAD